MILERVDDSRWSHLIIIKSDWRTDATAERPQLGSGSNLQSSRQNVASFTAPDHQRHHSQREEDGHEDEQSQRVVRRVHVNHALQRTVGEEVFVDVDDEMFYHRIGPEASDAARVYLSAIREDVVLAVNTMRKKMISHFNPYVCFISASVISFRSCSYFHSWMDMILWKNECVCFTRVYLLYTHSERWQTSVIQMGLNNHHNTTVLIVILFKFSIVFIYSMLSTNLMT